MKKITLYGAGGHCHAVIALIHQLGDYKVDVVMDDAPGVAIIDTIPVKKRANAIDDNAFACITIGNNVHRKKISEVLDKKFPSFMHPSVVHYGITLNEGTVLLPGAVLDIGVEIGAFSIINLNATIAHNVKIGDYCHVAINAAITGGVIINEGAFIAASSVILPNVKIGKWATVGAGAVVTKDVPDYAVVYGNPAKIIKYNTHE